MNTMKHFKISSVVCLICLVVISHPFPLTKEKNAVLYLQKYGYLEGTTDNRTDPIFSGHSISNALKDFQQFAGLDQTGVVDEETLAVIRLPRCGVKDRMGHSASTRKKRYALQGSKWSPTYLHLTYRISKYPSNIKDKMRVDKEIKKAFQIWSEVAPLSFTERKKGRINIDIRFERREHGDYDKFDGPGHVLAHAFFPQYGGNIHFDDEEIWTINEYSGFNLFQVAAHEIGHSLGLSHSAEKQAVMYPFQGIYEPSFKINNDDLKAIQAVYGSKEGITYASEEDFSDAAPARKDAPDICENGTIDTATRTLNGDSYLFKDDFYWQVLDHKLADGFPRRIQDDWNGLDGNLDASFMGPNGKTYFFKGRRYWKFQNKEMESGYPKLISQGFTGIPDNLDAAFVWTNNSKPYFFKGDSYWRYDSENDQHVDSRYPEPISNWHGIPNDIDAAFQFENNMTYFFKGDKYYKFDDKTQDVSTEKPPYPRLTSSWWFFCK